MNRRSPLAKILGFLPLRETIRSEIREIEPENGWRMYECMAIIREFWIGSWLISSERSESICPARIVEGSWADPHRKRS